MRKLTSVLVLLTIFLAGCNQQQAEVKAYLLEVNETDKQVKGFIDELSRIKSEFDTSVKAGQANWDVSIEEMTAVAVQAAEVKGKVEAMTVPEVASAHHQATVAAYGGTVDVIEKQLEMLNVGVKITDVVLQAQADPSKAKESQAKIEGYKAEMQGMQEDLNQSLATVQEQSDIQRAERTRLMEEFGLQAG